VSPDGKTVATASEDRTVRVWDGTGGKELLRLEGHEGPVYAVQSSPDGKTLASAGYDGTARIWDAASGKQRLLIREREPMAPIALSPDGAALASADREGRVCLWDCRTGVRRVLLPADREGVRALAFAPDGRSLAVGGGLGTVRLWEVASGGKRLEFRAYTADVARLAFAAGGRLLASGGYHYQPPRGQLVTQVRLWDARTGQKLRCLPDGHDFLALSRGGELLATGGRGGAVVLWQAATGKKVASLRGHRGASICGAFAAADSRLVTGSTDTTALVWDVSAARRGLRPAARDRAICRLRPQEVERLWADLAGADAASAYRAITALAESGDEAWFGRLRPKAPVDAARLTRLVAALDADDFATREQATAELKQMGELAGPLLRQTLERKPSPEVRRRVRRLLEVLGRSPSGEALRGLRAVEALEQAGTPAARRVLETLAKGAPQARLTREAADSLRRLTARPGSR
jgi:hypothetical protein